MKTIFKKLGFLILLMSIVSLQAQEKAITGVVSDAETGMPVPGASVVVKGTSKGVATNFDGEFEITLDTDETLIISYLGFKPKEITPAGNTNLTISLEPDAALLDEVVVVGYGTQKRKEVSGSVAQVAGEKLTQAPISTLTNSLTGRLPGLTINQRSAEPGRENSQILVRGVSTLGSNTALVVIDGVANVDGLDRLDPQDIESVTILKDAAAAIYGAQAANGVILVTTKRGKSGKPQFTYNLNSGMNSPISLPDLADGLEYVTMINRIAWRASGWDPDFTPTFSDEEVENIRNGTTPTYEWRDAAYRKTSFQTSHNISVRGGSETFRYFTSARYLNQNSIFEGDDIGKNRQYNIRTNLDLAVNKNLDLGLDIALRQQNVSSAFQRRNAVLVNSQLTPPILPRFINDDIRFPAAGRASQNPYSMIREGGYENNELRNLSANLKFNYKIPSLEGLAIGGFVSYGVNTDFDKQFQTPWSFYLPNTDDPTGDPIRQQAGIIRLDQSYSRANILTSNFRTTYRNSFGNHNLDVLLQVEKQTQKYDEFRATNDNFLSRASDQLNSGSRDRSDSEVAGLGLEAARIGYSGRLNYNYKEKYIAQLLFRYDGSERFAPGQRFGFFPGMTAAWVISEEDFLKDNSTINSLKLRGSWGQLGNDRIPAFNYLSRFRFAGNIVVNGNTTPGVVEEGISNPNVTWEVAETINLGIEATLFRNHLTIEADVFDTQTKDILASPSITLPQYTGITPPLQNIGIVQNRGFEFSTAYRESIGEFNFTIGGNVAFSRNKVVFVDEVPFDEEYQNQTGKPLGSGLIYDAIGIFRTQEQLDNLPTRPGDALGSAIIRDTNGDGEITIADRIRLDKTANPEWVYGITTNVSYKNFDLNLLWQGASGGIKTISNIFGPGNNNWSYFARETWAPDNVDAALPAPGQSEDTNIYKIESNYLRLKTLEAGYTFPTKAINAIGLDNVRLYVSGFNVITFDANSHIGGTDPEQNDSRGWDFPNLRTWNLGFNISF